MAAEAAEELPRAIVRRVVKDKLASLAGEGDVVLHKEALLAFSESARIFIHYLSATANDICKEARRQTINAEDVLKALEEIEFSEFIESLRASLDEFREKAAGKRAGSAKAKETSKKRKISKDPAAENGKDNEANPNEDGKDNEANRNEDGKDNEANRNEEENEGDEGREDNETNGNQDENEGEKDNVANGDEEEGKCDAENDSHDD